MLFRSYEKLRRGGFPPDACRRVVEDMVKIGYLNESKQLCRLVSELANHSLFGPKRIMAKLMSHGYAASDIQLAIRSAKEEGILDFDASFEKLCLKNSAVGADSEALTKLKYKYGYK